jgi:hypothetical protein
MIGTQIAGGGADIGVAVLHFQATFAASWRGGRLRNHASAASTGINVRAPAFTALRRPADNSSYSLLRLIESEAQASFTLKAARG